MIDSLMSELTARTTQAISSLTDVRSETAFRDD